MKKVNKKPSPLIYPVPAAMVSCGISEDEYNIITIAWTGTVCSVPPMCYISIRKERHSYDIVKRTKEFVFNYSTKDMAYEADWCGRKSGKDHQKFKELNLTPGNSVKIKTPVIAESPINLECKVKEIIPLGSHDMFIAEIVNIQVSDQYINPTNGTINMQHQVLMAFSHGKYVQLGEIIEQAGFSIKNKQ